MIDFELVLSHVSREMQVYLHPHHVILDAKLLVKERRPRCSFSRSRQGRASPARSADAERPRQQAPTSLGRAAIYWRAPARDERVLGRSGTSVQASAEIATAPKSSERAAAEIVRSGDPVRR